jgi:hypothetical protein
MAGSLGDLSLDRAFDHRSELDTGSDVVNVRLEMLWNMIPIPVS